jgi:hypothetical protein
MDLAPSPTDESLPNVESLPNELIVEIALRVEDPSLASLFRVSRRFAALSSDDLFWKRRCDHWFSHYYATTLFDTRSNPSWREKYQFFQVSSRMKVYANDYNYLIDDEPSSIRFYWSNN